MEETVKNKKTTGEHMKKKIVMLVAALGIAGLAVTHVLACDKCDDDTCPQNACTFTNVNNQVLSGSCTSSFYNGCPCNSGGIAGSGC